MQGFILPQDLKISKDLEITIASEVASTKIEIDLGVLRSSFSSSVLITTLYLHFVFSRKLSCIGTELSRKFCTFIHPKSLFLKSIWHFLTYLLLMEYHLISYLSTSVTNPRRFFRSPFIFCTFYFPLKWLGSLMPCYLHWRGEEIWDGSH